MIKFIQKNGEWQQWEPSCELVEGDMLATPYNMMCWLDHHNFEAVQSSNLDWIYKIYNGIGTEIIKGLENEWHWFVEMVQCFPCGG